MVSDEYGDFYRSRAGCDTVDQYGIYGTQGIGSPSNVLGSRDNSISWIDSNNNLWLFGGNGYDATGSQGMKITIL